MRKMRAGRVQASGCQPEGSGCCLALQVEQLAGGWGNARKVPERGGPNGQKRGNAETPAQRGTWQCR